ncbi:MAG: hypothetical protein H8E75_06010 [Puniceicoccaceae bacterium]|jgi:hypothetical protein|nr:hypothetical protein [Puniceicoccaceae bacterium]MBL6920515.1 hypothetical protein [Puniceicoccaceae bacterium]
MAAVITILFSDNGWNGTSGEFRDNEGTFSWTSTSTLTAGTMVDYTDNAFSIGSYAADSGTFAASASGDTILAFTGSKASPTFAGGIGWAMGTPWTFFDNPNTSDIPTEILGNQIELGTSDNYVYTGITSGTVAQLRTAIQDVSNWSGDNSTAVNYGGVNFNIAPEPSSFALLAGVFALASVMYRRRGA